MESFKKDYDLCEQIGEGRYGVVHRCVSPASGTSFAVKSVQKQSTPNANNEPNLLALLPPHPNIIRIHNHYDSDSHLLIVTDLCQSSDLHHRLTATGPFSEPQSRSILFQLVSALAHCHRHGVAHCDVKPENVLFDSLGNLKLCDFGFAQRFVDSGGERVPIRGKFGTPDYIAPEVLKGSDYDEKVDVWGAGVVLYALLGGVLPFSAESVMDTLRAVVRADVSFSGGAFRCVSAEGKDLIRKMLRRDVATRFTAQQVLNHPWVVSRGRGRGRPNKTPSKTLSASYRPRGVRQFSL